MKRVYHPLFAVAFALALACQGAPVLPAVAPQANSKQPVMAKYLNPGGSFYLCLDSSSWAKKLEQGIAQLQAALKDSVPPEDEEDVKLFFHFLNAFVRDSGLRDLGGLGASSVATAKDMYHNRLFVQHPPGGPKGLMWDAFTAENQPLDLLQRLPADTAFAQWATVRPKPVWEWVKRTVEGCGNPAAIRTFREGVEAAKNEGFDVERVVSALGGGIGGVVTLDATKTIQIALDNDAEMEVPAFTAALLVEVEDDTLFDLFGKILTDEEGAKRVDQNGIRAYVCPAQEIPDVTGLKVGATLARFDQYVALSTSYDLVRTLAARRGGLLAAPRFQRHRQAVPTAGFAFSYLDPLVSQSLHAGVMQVAALAEPGLESVIEAMFSPFSEIHSFSVSLRTPDGIATVANQSMGVVQSLASRCTLLPMLLVAAVWSEEEMVIGEDVVAEMVAEDEAEPSDAGNLESIALALFLYSAIHDEKYPADLGVLIKEELIEPGNLVSPGSATKPPTTVAEVRAGRCDYLYFGKGRKFVEEGVGEPLACTRPGLHEGKGIAVIYDDHHVETLDQIPEKIKKMIEALQKDPK